MKPFNKNKLSLYTANLTCISTNPLFHRYYYTISTSWDRSKRDKIINGWLKRYMKKVGQTINQLKKETLLKLVNGRKPEDHSTVSLFNRVEMARSITILDKDLNTKTYSIAYDNLNFQYVIYLLLPLLFSVTTIV